MKKIHTISALNMVGLDNVIKDAFKKIYKKNFNDQKQNNIEKMESNRLISSNKNYSQILNAKTIVIKIGSSILIDPKKNILKNKWLNSLLDEIAFLKKNGKNIIIVSSGSIALGKSVLNLSSKKLKLDESQASAAIGQIKLAQAYDLILKKNIIFIQHKYY